MSERTRIAVVALTGLLSLTVLSVDFTADAAVPKGFKVIVNHQVNLAVIHKDEIKQIMMKKVSRFSNGTGAAPVDQPPDSPVREAFSRDVLGRSAAAVSSFWQRQIFSGKEVPPPSASNDAGVIAHVGSVSGGLGYVSENAKLPDSVIEVRLVD